MERIEQWLQRLYKRRITNNFDAVVLVLGGEGVGKSTFMLGATWLWQQLREQDPTPKSVIDRMAHDDREAFRKLLLSSESGDAIIANDAAHILHKKEAMHGDQIETEKSLLDIRTFNYFIQLGYQDWDDVTDQLQRRRAHFALKIPRRGVIHGYSRESLDEKYATGDWPEPDLVDTFPKLDGTDLWAEFQAVDEERKRERLEQNETPDPEDARWEEQAKFALRLVRPWDDDSGLTQADASKLIDYSDSWVSNRVNEWRKEGKHHHLIGDDEKRIPLPFPDS